MVLKINFSLDVFHNTHPLRFVSDSQRQSFSVELTLTLALGWGLGLGLRLAWGHLQDIKTFHLHKFQTFFPGHLWQYSSFAFGFRFSTLIVFPGVNPNPTLKLRLGLGLGLAWGHFQDKKFFVPTSFKDFSLEVYDDTHFFAFAFRFSTLIVFPGVNPNPNPKAKLRVRVRVSLGSLPGYRIFHLDKF